MTDFERLYHDDRRQQIEACNELAPESQHHFINQPWKALEHALRNRNFENKKLIERIAELENICREMRKEQDDER